MKLICEALDLFDSVPLAEWDTQTGEHGKIVEVRFEAYNDVIVYEDGYKERLYIGE